MKKIEITDYAESWQFSIENFKIILGDNKYRLYRSLYHQLAKEEVSEFESEQDERLEIKINGQKYDLKVNRIFSLNMFSNFDEEIKLSSKSLLIEYLDAQLKDVDYQDVFIMLNQSIELINQELLDEINVESNETRVAFSLQPFTLKSLIKNTIAEIYKNDLHACDFDLKLIEKIRLYLKTMVCIADKNQARHYFVLVVLDEMSPIIYDEIKGINKNNLQLIVFVNLINCIVEYQDIYMIGKLKMDFGDDESIYENLVIEKGIALDLPDSKRILVEYCKNPKGTSRFSSIFTE